MKYGQKVKIKSGFYEGMEGIVVRENKTISGHLYGTPVGQVISYIVRLGNSDDIHDMIISESDLELIK